MKDITNSYFKCMSNENINFKNYQVEKAAFVHSDTKNKMQCSLLLKINIYTNITFSAYCPKPICYYLTVPLLAKKRIKTQITYMDKLPETI